MSLFGALDTAVGGMNVQSTALSTISNNVANSQTVGYKGADTTFKNYVSGATATTSAPSAVIAMPQYSNTVQGAITSVSNPTSLAISGGGFFAVQSPTSASTFSTQPYFTRVGDFTPNSSGYLINSTGYALDGWPASNTAGTTFNANAAGPVQISKSPSPPVPTSTISLAANIPSIPPTGTTNYTSTTQIYDAGGNAQDLTSTWSQITSAGPVSSSNVISASNVVIPNQWDLTLSSGAQSSGPMLVTFGDGTATLAGGTTVAAVGSIASIGAPTTSTGMTAVPATNTAGTTATINLGMNFGLGTQPISLNLGEYGQPTGITQFTGTSFQVTSQTQDGTPQGNYSSVTVQPTGNVVISYDNGATKTIAKVPLVSFENADALAQQDGQTYTATVASGAANVVTAGTAGTGTLVVGAEEGSNVDIASQFTSMIVAQQAYTANSKMISTANQMLQTASAMIQG